MLSLSKDAKTFIHIALIVAAAVVAGISIHPLTTLSVLQVAAGALTSIVVYIGTNSDTGFWKYLKFYLAALGAAVTAVGTYLVGNAGLATVTPSDWLTVVFVALGALGVIAVGETPSTLLDAGTASDIPAVITNVPEATADDVLASVVPAVPSESSTDANAAVVTPTA